MLKQDPVNGFRRTRSFNSWKQKRNFVRKREHSKSSLENREKEIHFRGRKQHESLLDGILNRINCQTGFMSLPRGVDGRSEVCDCGISWSYLLFYFQDEIAEMIKSTSHVLYQTQYSENSFY